MYFIVNGSIRWTVPVHHNRRRVTERAEMHLNTAGSRPAKEAGNNRQDNGGRAGSIVPYVQPGALPGSHVRPQVYYIDHILSYKLYK